LGDGCIIATIQYPVSSIQYPVDAEIWHLPKDKGRVNLLELLKKAASMGIQSIMVEGGSKVFTQFLAKGLVNKIYFFIAPKILGEGIPVIENTCLLGRQVGVQRLEQVHLRNALRLSSVKYRRFGEDILLEGYVKRE